MSFAVVRPEDLEFVTRSHEPGEPQRHVAAVTERAGLRATRAVFVRFDPGTRGPRYDEEEQEFTYVPLRGTLTMYLGEPPELHEVPVGGVIHVTPDTLRQVANESGEELLLYVVAAS
jgi:quercetin dioxygenase-like cupin family protein